MDSLRRFCRLVLEGYEIIENLAVYSDKVQFAGFARVEILEGTEMTPAPLVFLPGGFYKTRRTLGEGSQFRFVAGSGESAYVYAFAVSQAPDTPAGPGEFYSPVLLFPQTGVSPLLNYNNSTIVLPGEDRTLVLGANPGMEYLFLLYAKQALDIHAIMRRFQRTGGTPSERLAAAVGSGLLKPKKMRYSEENAAFTVETNDSRALAALVVAIDHR